MWNNTTVSEALRIKYPIIQGAFGGRFSSVELVAAVSNAGGMGSFGLNARSPQEILEINAAIRKCTVATYALNLWVPLADDPVKEFDELAFEAWKHRFEPYFAKLGLPLPEKPDLPRRSFEAQLEAVLQAKPPVVSFIFGIPSDEIFRELKHRGIVTIASATTADEARLLEDSPIDLIIATGQNAGGHRPSFLKSPEDSLTDTKSLVKQVLEVVKKPVIAAGGISNGIKAAEYLQLGASGVQVGTAFLATDESGASDLHKTNLRSEHSYQTDLTRVFTGRLARSITSEFIQDFNESSEPIYAPYPLQSKLMNGLWNVPDKEQATSYMPLWAGVPSAILKHTHAEDLFVSLVNEINAEMG
ncbi:MAG: nitronate monooxygenase [Cytophagales bacterium]|nr:nitronate monooxygenase [Cytophagales bacterium]